MERLEVSGAIWGPFAWAYPPLGKVGNFPHQDFDP